MDEDPVVKLRTSSQPLSSRSAASSTLPVRLVGTAVLTRFARCPLVSRLLGIASALYSTGACGGAAPVHETKSEAVSGVTRPEPMPGDGEHGSSPEQRLPMVKGELRRVPAGVILLELALTERRIGGVEVLELEEGRLPRSPVAEDAPGAKVREALLAEAKARPSNAVVSFAIAADARPPPNSAIVRVAELAEIRTIGLVARSDLSEDGFIQISSPSRAMPGAAGLRMGGDGVHGPSGRGRSPQLHDERLHRTGDGRQRSAAFAPSVRLSSLRSAAFAPRGVVTRPLRPSTRGTASTYSAGAKTTSLHPASVRAELFQLPTQAPGRPVAGPNDCSINTCPRGASRVAIPVARWQATCAAMKQPILISAVLLAMPGCFSPDQTRPQAGSDEGSGTTEGISSTVGGPLPTGPSGGLTSSSGGGSSLTSTAFPSSDDSTTGDGVGAEVGTSAQNCEEAGGVCVPSPRRPWSRPAVRSLAGCGEPFSTLMTSVVAAVEVVPGTCECECGTPLAECAATRSAYSGSCSGELIGSNSWSTTLTCYQISHPANGVNHVANSLDPEDEQCAGTLSEHFPEPTPVGELDLCLLDQRIDGLCAGRMDCVPPASQPAQPGLCVVAPGDLSCPGGFPEREVLYEAMDDDRFCPLSCECGVSGGSCEMSWGVFEENTCNGTPLLTDSTTSGDPVCLTPPDRPELYAQLTSVEYVAGECSAPAPEPASGAVFLSGAVTVCCQGG